VNRGNQLAAVILAAGASQRMGRPKAALVYDGETFLARAIRLFSPLCDPVIVVLPPAGMICPPGVLCTVNPVPERGMLSSLQCGFRAVPDRAEQVFFMPVDLPAISGATVAALAEHAGTAPLILPRYEGRRGHPVLVRRDLIPEFLALSPSAQARDIVERHEGEIRYVDVNDPGILADVDTPADYERITAGIAR